MVFAVTTVVLLASFVLPAQGYAEDFIWCDAVSAGTKEKPGTNFFSEVFPGDYYKQKYDIEKAWTAFLDANYDDGTHVASCSFARDRSKARSDRDQKKAVTKYIVNGATQTNWTY